MEHKIKNCEEVIRKAIKKFGIEKTAVAWTGGKDSTVLLWLVKNVCEEKNFPLPNVLFVNEGHVFEEVYKFVNEMKRKWNLNVIEVKNYDILKQVKKVGEMVRVKDLSARNKKELEAINFKGDEFPFEPESYVGNHLMKTVALNTAIENYNIKAIFSGIRWDEQKARANETYFSVRKNPNHTRIHPILHLKEKDIWDIIHKYHIPYNELYAQGYRSLGAKGTTTKTSNIPAWEQDLQNTKEREERRQDKENIMKKLRELGYF
jgi:phosphoadenosine phosphosulfate reductase